MSVTLRLGTREVEIPGEGRVGEMRDSTAVVGDGAALRSRIEADGYLLLRNFHPVDEVLRARHVILAHLRAAGVLADDALGSSARCRPGVSTPNMKGQREITHHSAVAGILEGPRVQALFADVFGEGVRTFDYKWLRATPPGEFTGVHADTVYMGRGSQRLLSCWVPFGEVTPALGAIALCAGSEQLPEFEPVRRTYGCSDSDRDGYGGWLTLDPLEISERFGGRWLTTDFHPGDVLVFGMQMLHASFVNTSDEYRLSCDVRFQPASDPIDERWVGARALEPKHNDGPRVATPEMRHSWGI